MVSWGRYESMIWLISLAVVTRNLFNGNSFATSAALAEVCTLMSANLVSSPFSFFGSCDIIVTIVRWTESMFTLLMTSYVWGLFVDLPVSSTHWLKIRILLILKFPQIHDFFTNFKTVNFKIHKIQIITFIAAKFQLKLFDANTALNFWIKNCDVIQDSLTRRQISMITCSLLQSLWVACSFTVFPNIRIAVLICPLFPFNSFNSNRLQRFFSTVVAS